MYISQSIYFHHYYAQQNEHWMGLFGEFRIHPASFSLQDKTESYVWENFKELIEEGTSIPTDPSWFRGNSQDYASESQFKADTEILCDNDAPLSALENIVKDLRDSIYNTDVDGTEITLARDSVYLRANIPEGESFKSNNDCELIGRIIVSVVEDYRQLKK